MGAAALEDLVDHRAGLLGISGLPATCGACMSRHDSADARLAIEMFCYSVRKQLAAMMAVLGGADAIVFTGGIGENDAEVRAAICAGLSWLGVRLDEARNRGANDPINDFASSCAVHVLTSQEDEQIARHTWALIPTESLLDSDRQRWLKLPATPPRRAIMRGAVDLVLPVANGLQVTAKLREKLHREIPVIILTGDISTSTLRDIALQNCVQLNKPVKLKELTQVIQRLLPISQSAVHPDAPHPAERPAMRGPPVIFAVDDDSHVCEGIRALLQEDGRTVEAFSTCEAFLQAYYPGREGCLLIDAYLPGERARIAAAAK